MALYSIVEFPHLTLLYMTFAIGNYVEQLLNEKKTHLLCPIN
jgi:hypothetical protein